jgi:hypothetical protein
MPIRNDRRVRHMKVENLATRFQPQVLLVHFFFATLRLCGKCFCVGPAPDNQTVTSEI